MADLFAGQKIGYAEKEECARRELAFRRRCYPRWVDQGKLSQDEAERQIEVMSAIVDDYAKCTALERSGRDRIARG